MPAPIPKNETKRLEVLWQYDVLDTAPEEVFDDLTDLAASICEAPFAMISLVDQDRQWFKSKTGVTFGETSRDISFCAHAILRKNLFVVPDTWKDVRFKRNPMVTNGQKIRFYAGAPLITPDGYGLGALCVLDNKPRQLRPVQKRALRILARHVISQLELRLCARQLTAARADEKKLRAQLAKALAENARHFISQLELRICDRRLAAARADEKKLRAQLAKALDENARLRRELKSIKN
jgi:GAF domain-containing protein